MKRTSTILAAIVGLFTLAATSSSLAADNAKEITVTGEAKCAKCALHLTDKCQTVLQTEKDGKTITYYLMGDPAKEFHETICQGPKKAKATGTVETKDGKTELMVSKVEEVK
jgi:hypothetical protein